jgi:hypothetical protein
LTLTPPGGAAKRSGNGLRANSSHDMLGRCVGLWRWEPFPNRRQLVLDLLLRGRAWPCSRREG